MIFRAWAAGLAATLASWAVARPMVPLQLQCSGRDPEWRLDAGPEAAQLTRADAKPVSEMFCGTLLRLVSPQWDGAAWRGAVPASPSRALAATVRREACAEPGAPSGANARGAVVPPDGPPLAGCCRTTFSYDLARAPLADFETKAAEDWSARCAPAWSTAACRSPRSRRRARLMPAARRFT